MKYLVGIREIHISTYTIEAESEDAARQKVLDCEGDFVDSEYSDTWPDCVSFVKAF